LRKSFACLFFFAAASGHSIASAEPQAGSLAGAVATGTNAWGVPPTDIPPDPALRLGRLPNGMKYAIRANSTPKGAASIRLHFNFGSMAEAEDERGLAHFIEHMAFNGTTHVPEGEMKKMLERQGLSFGPDSNAFTSFDSTIYLLELPKADEQRLDTALFLLRETASEIRFDPAAVDRERGVILSEKRSREGFQLRRTLDNLAFHMPRSAYAKRLPIGTEQVLKGASADKLVELYQRYYRPENATLVIVGDVDPASVEAKIRARFGDWAGKGPAGPRPQPGLVDFKRPADFASFADPAVETTASITVFTQWKDPPDTRAERRRTFLEQIGLAMLTRRLQQLADAPDARLISAAARRSPSRDLAWASTISAVARDGEWQAALATIEQELRRALGHGFTARELRVQLADIQGAHRMAADQADTRSNASLASAILGIIDGNEFITTPQFRLDFFNAIRPTITVAEVNAEFRKLWSGSAPLVFVTDKRAVSKRAIAAVLDNSRKVAVLPPADKGPLKFAYDDFGNPGAIVADSRIPDLGIRTVRFANNVRLNIKRTDFEKGAVRYSIRLAGGSLALPRDKVGLPTMVNSLSSLAALEKHSAEDLKEIMAGHGVSPGLAVGTDAILAQGRTIPHDFPLQMKLSAAFITAPGYRPEAATRWHSLVPIIDKQVKATAQSLFNARAPMIIANDDPRFGYPGAGTLSQRSLGEARAALAPLFHSAPIEIGIVGDIDEAAAIAAVAGTFGALPQRQRDAPSYSEARRVAFRQSLAPAILRHAGQPDQAIVAEAWATNDDEDFERAVGLNLLAEVLKLSLDDELREALGATYGVSVRSYNSDVFDGFGYLLVNTLVAPDKIPAVEAALEAVIADMRAKPVSDDLLSRARNPLIERIERQQRENVYWLSLVDEAQTDSEALARHRQRKAAYLAVSAEDLRKLANHYLLPGKRVRIHVLPEEPRLAERATP
jgi:zinc protease